MTQTPNPVPPVATVSGERWWIWFFCLLAVIHVLVFSAAFPFFNNVDEPYHFDLVIKYSHLRIPQKPEAFSPESLQYIVIFSTWEYLLERDTLYAPPWKQPASEIAPVLLSRETRWQTTNREFSQPPLYYLLSGTWWRLAAALGFHDGFLLYLLRFFNVLIAGPLVWTGWTAARLVFPGNLFVRMGVCALLAFMPQTVFYTVSNDVLSPLCFGLAFVCLLRFWSAETPRVSLGAFTGLALAATYLAKGTNFPVLAVSSVFVLLKIQRLAKANQFKLCLPALCALFVCAVAPVAIWVAWCKRFYGDFTGAPEKIHLLGWTIKPFSQWWHHPIFTPTGLWTYLSGQLGTFWQGEFLWHNQPLVLPETDLIYTVFSLGLLAFVLLRLFSPSSNLAQPQVHALWFSLACFAAELGFFALMSVVYDFNDCINPSRQHPYFHAGRMLLGALIPFLLLIVYGVDRALNRFGNTTKFIILAATVIAMLCLEIATDKPVFNSQYNWFHM